MADNRNRSAITLRLAAVLLVLVIISSSLLSGRYARYVSTAAPGGDARVAMFSVTKNSGLLTQNISANIIPGGSSETTVTVKNDSEVAVRYRLDVTNPYGNLPLSFQVKVDGNLYDMPFEADMAPNTQATYVVVTSWIDTADIKYVGRVDLLEISVSSTQID